MRGDQRVTKGFMIIKSKSQTTIKEVWVLVLGFCFLADVLPKFSIVSDHGGRPGREGWE